MVDFKKTRTAARATLAGPPWWAALLPAIAGGGVLAGGFALGLAAGDDLKWFYYSYLVSYCFYLSLSLGALFFVALQHVVRAGWSVAVRRLAEILAANLLLMAVLFLPILVPMLRGNTSLYCWSDAAAVKADPLLAHKAPYLNVPMFAVRAAVYFGVWVVSAWFFFAGSLRQDRSGNPAWTRWMERLSAPVLLAFAVTITFAAFDWLMSLEPAWFSTIFGVYYFSGAVVGFFAALILLALAFQQAGRLTEHISIEHYHELGKLLFGFIIFWGYIAFSQYLLIWYANIPEETAWYRPRQSGPWAWVGVALVFGHLLIPFFGLVSRAVKRRKIALGFWAAWMLAVHWIDIEWLVMPARVPGRVSFGLIDVCCLVGIGCLYAAGVLALAGACRLVPVKDPRLSESLAFENP